MTKEPHLRMEDKSRLVPKGMLQSTYPLTPAEDALAASVGTDSVVRHRPTELNPSGIYAPPGDPLARTAANFRDLAESSRKAAVAIEDFTQAYKALRWRWWRDPMVIGAAIGVAVLLALVFAVVP